MTGIKLSENTIKYLAKDIAAANLTANSVLVDGGVDNQFGHILFVWVGKEVPAEAHAAVLEMIKNAISPEVSGD